MKGGIRGAWDPQATVGYSSFQIGCELVENGLFNSYTKSDTYTFWYNFDTVLYQFLEAGTSDRCLKLYVSFNAWDYQVSS